MHQIASYPPDIVFRRANQDQNASTFAKNAPKHVPKKSQNTVEEGARTHERKPRITTEMGDPRDRQEPPKNHESPGKRHPNGQKHARTDSS